MSTTKARGRVSATQIIEATSTSPLISNIATAINPTNALQQQYVPSLLKIESVVPSRLNASSRNLQQRAARLMTRSYSTLCGPASITNGTTSIAASNTTITAAAAVVNYKNVSKRINSNFPQQQQQTFRHHHHRHKNHREAGESPTGNKATNNQQANSESTFVAIENGVHKVRRTHKEKEKQPDRINLDRRGLCTIPVIDNEPNLRLLSLQHNLINTFHIPDYELVDQLPPDGVKDSNNNNALMMSSKDVDLYAANNGVISNKAGTPSKGGALLRQKSRNQLNLNFSANSNGVGNGTNSMLAAGSGVGGSVKPNGTITPTSFLQKSFMFQAAKSGLLKRANSVMINYSPAQTPTGANVASNSTIFGSLQRGKLVATPSFSVIDINTNHHHEMVNGIAMKASTSPTEQPPLPLQIDANNSYMNSFRFNLTNLVFLDLYNNQIEKISNLDGLKSLTVLLLGKNRISDITGIISLKHTLRVLDLHGNRITHIAQKICQLQELKSLNLAGNLLRQIQSNDFAGLCCLKELNLKRNRIKKINVSDDLHNLERLWLCHNELACIDDMSTIAKSINLKEITIENNPISLAGDCVSFLVSYLPMLVSLNQLQITEQVRRAANAWRRSKENTDQIYQHLSSDVSSSIRREEIISNARTNWELIRSQQAHIINGSQRQANQIKKSIKSKLTSTHSSSSTSTTSSSNANNIENGTNNNSCNKKKKKNMMDAPAVKKRQKPKLLRSTSHENTSSIISDSDCNHLPPMMDQFDGEEEKKKKMPPKKRSASSTRPNVDSESDFVGSDEDDARSFKSQVPTTPPINPPSTSSQISSPVEIIIRDNEGEESQQSFTPPLPPIVEPTRSSPLPAVATPPSPSESPLDNNESLTSTPTPTPKAPMTIIDNSTGNSLQPASNIEQTIPPPVRLKTAPQVELKMDAAVECDKLSTVSKTSTVKTTESNVTSSSPTNEDHRQVHAIGHAAAVVHPRNRSVMSNRKIGAPLVRSQTARNLSSHLHNQIAAGLASNQLNQGGGGSGNNNNAAATSKKESKKEIDKDREQGGDYLVEILGRYLNVYGVGAIKFVDKQWNPQKAQDVHTVKFSYINFNSISTILGRVKVRFPNVENYVFRETNIICLGQLNAMADTQGLKSITIDPEGNHIVANNKNWRAYAIWRLNHWGLKSINGMEITEDEIAEAERTYNGLSDLVLWSLPESLLNPLFARLRVDEMLQSTKITPKEWLMKQSDESIRHVVGKEALQWKKTNAAQQEEAIVRRKGKLLFGHMMENTVNAVEKLQKLEFLWPNILLEMIRNTLIDYSQIDLYVRNLLSELNSNHNFAASSNAGNNNNTHNNNNNNVINNTLK